MKLVRLLAIVFAAALVGGAAGSVITLLVRNDGDNPHVRGSLVHLGPPDSLARFTPQPFCVALHHFCISQPETGKPIALYTYDPHPIFREQGCEVVWHADRNHENQDGSTTHGTFDDPCGGSVYDITGHRLFGPSPRDLDSFRVEISKENNTVVDTRTLICGGQQRIETHDCPRAPLGD